jgi:hypothetical protein
MTRLVRRLVSQERRSPRAFLDPWSLEPRYTEKCRSEFPEYGTMTLSRPGRFGTSMLIVPQSDHKPSNYKVKCVPHCLVVMRFIM